MFTNILFLLLALVMTTSLPHDGQYGLFNSTVTILCSTLSIWTATLIAIWTAHKFKWLSPSSFTIFFNTLTLFTLGIGLFFFGLAKAFAALPSIFLLPTALAYYLSAISWGHWLVGGSHAAKRQLLFLCPFIIPFTILWLLFETPLFQTDSEVLAIILSLAVVIAVMVFLPFAIQRIWQCEPLPKGDLNQKLQALCNKMNFNHSGLKVWTLMNHSYTAAIIGVVPKYRFVMFTPNVIERFKPEWTEAILAHEIGHSKYRHLIYYPFITTGMVIASILATDSLSNPLFSTLSGLENSYPTFPWRESYFFTLFLLFALFVSVGLRFFFGFFSRLFERQADIYIFEAGIDACHMIDALNEIGNVTGYSHDKPNWHHFSIRERINFLNMASKNPVLIANHHKKVSICLKIYFLVLILLLLAANTLF